MGLNIPFRRLALFISTVLFTVATFGTPRIAKVAMAEIHSPDVDAYVNLFGAYYYDSSTTPPTEWRTSSSMFYTLNSTLLTEVSPTATFTSSKILIANLLATVFGLATLTILIFGVFATGDLTFGSKKEDEHDTDAPVLDFLYSILLSIFLSCSSMSFVFNLIFVCASVPDIVSPYPNYTHSPGMAFWIALAAQLTPLAIVIVALIMLTVAYFFPNWEISETLIPRHSR